MSDKEWAGRVAELVGRYEVEGEIFVVTPSADGKVLVAKSEETGVEVPSAGVIFTGRKVAGAEKADQATQGAPGRRHKSALANVRAGDRVMIRIYNGINRFGVKENLLKEGTAVMPGELDGSWVLDMDRPRGTQAIATEENTVLVEPQEETEGGPNEISANRPEAPGSIPSGPTVPSQNEEGQSDAGPKPGGSVGMRRGGTSPERWEEVKADLVGRYEVEGEIFEVTAAPDGSALSARSLATGVEVPVSMMFTGRKVAGGGPTT